MNTLFDLVTSTAAVVVFDPVLLEHRIPDPPDWWADPDQEIAELNAGNALVVGLGSDGRYSVVVNPEALPPGPAVGAKVRCESGRFFIGPGEDITGGDLEPRTGKTTGIFFPVEPATYCVTITKLRPFELGVTIKRTEDPAINKIDQQLLLL